jgi:hypothetical protein
VRGAGGGRTTQLATTVPAMVPGGRAGLVLVMGASGTVIVADVVHRILHAVG